MRDHPNVIHSLVLGGQVASSIVVQRPANQANESKLVNQSIGLLQFRPSLSGCSLRDHSLKGVRAGFLGAIVHQHLRYRNYTLYGVVAGPARQLIDARH